MSKQLERAIAAARKHEARVKALQQHDDLVRLSVEQLKLVRAKDYVAAEEANVNANTIMQEVRGEQPQEES